MGWDPVNPSDGEQMEMLIGGLVAQRIIVTRLMAFVANQQEGRELFIANFREACLRSLEYSIGGASDRASNDTLPHAQKIMVESCDAAGRAS